MSRPNTPPSSSVILFPFPLRLFYMNGKTLAGALQVPNRTTMWSNVSYVHILELNCVRFSFIQKDIPVSPLQHALSSFLGSGCYVVTLPLHLFVKGGGARKRQSSFLKSVTDLGIPFPLMGLEVSLLMLVVSGDAGGRQQKTHGHKACLSAYWRVSCTLLQFRRR